jgi:feruloyl esterase
MSNWNSESVPFDGSLGTTSAGLKDNLVALALSLVAIASVWATAAAPVAPPQATACSGLAGAVFGSARVTGAEVVDDGRFVTPGAQSVIYDSLPPFCRVSIISRPTEGSEIQSEVWLPLTTWNGRFQGVGNRGWGGSINYALLTAAIRTGFAAASTDTGHRGGGAWFALGQPERVIDAGYRAVHEMTGAAKQAVATFYGESASFAYWNGCSLGGRQGLSLAQRYPDDYDGIIVGDPVHNLTDLYSARLAIARTVHRSAESYIPPEKYPAVHQAVVDACDALDGVTDGVLEDPRKCRFDPAVLACAAGTDANSCLTPAQVETARAMYDDVRHPTTGERLSTGLQPGAERRWNAVGGPDADANALGLFRYVVLGRPDWDWRGDDFSDAVDRVRAEAGPVFDAVDPDLSRFTARGGRLLLYHGWADPQTPAGNTIAYYEAVAAYLGADRVDDHVALFMVPGMGHCSGGEGTDTFDPVTPLVGWVERGERPTRIEAARIVEGRTIRTRPLCPWGQVAAWDGRGPVDDSASFTCRALGTGDSAR